MVIRRQILLSEHSKTDEIGHQNRKDFAHVARFLVCCKGREVALSLRTVVVGGGKFYRRRLSRPWTESGCVFSKGSPGLAGVK